MIIKKIARLLPSLAVIAAIGAVLILPTVALAAGVDVLDQSCEAGGDSSEICNAGDDLFGAGSIWQNIVYTLIYVIGAVAVLMIVVGGFRYITAAGDQSQLTAAKNTILYAVVGLVLAVSAGGIVRFVLGRI